MSVTFTIPNKKKFFGYQPCMSIKECLAFSKQDLSQFSVDETLDGFDLASFYKQPLGQLEVLTLGVYKKSGRGFELSFDKENQTYNVRILTPSTQNDWIQAINLIHGLSKELHATKLTVEGEPIASQAIWDFDYQHDILFGLKHIQENMTNGDHKFMVMPGLLRTWHPNASMIEDIMQTPDPIANYSQQLIDHQYLDAYDAKQQFFETNDGKIIGNYTLTQGVETILPFEPSVDFQNLGLVKDDQIQEWHLSIVGHEGDGSRSDMYFRIGLISYQDFIAYLPEEAYQPVDARNFMTKGLSQDDLLSLYQKSTPIL